MMKEGGRCLRCLSLYAKVRGYIEYRWISGMRGVTLFYLVLLSLIPALALYLCRIQHICQLSDR